MTDINEEFYNFESPDDFNAKLLPLMPDAWEQVEKCTTFFSKIIKSNGLNSFAPTVVVFNDSQKFVGVISSRQVNDKEDLYTALCEMLLFPVSIKSDLFIVVTDTNVKDSNGEKISDALNLAFVSSDFCFIYNIPYEVNEANEVHFTYKDSILASVSKVDQNTKLTSSGDMVEILFVYSHVDNFGPFTYEEVLAYFDDNDIVYEIVNRENLMSSVSSVI